MIGIIITALAYLVGGVVFYKFTRARGFDQRTTSQILLAALVGGILGAKISSLLLSSIAVASAGGNPLILLAHPDGRTILGGVIVGWLSVEWVKKRLKVTRSTGDGFALALCAGEAIGRIGCFVNGCCYGIACRLPWSVYQAGAWRHPTQLYTAILDLFFLFLLIAAQKKVRYEGDLFRIYLLLFGSSRFFMEFVRERSQLIFGLSIAQWVSLEIAISMLVALYWTYFIYKPDDLQAETK